MEEGGLAGMKRLGRQSMLVKQVLAEDLVLRLFSPYLTQLHADIEA
jgi:hypothetical protein